MSPAAESLTLEERLGEFFRQLDLRRFHVAAGHAIDALALARTFADRIASMTLMCPARLSAEPFRTFDTRVLLIGGDRGPNAPVVPELLQNLPHARAVRLRDHVDAAWSDTVADRREEVASILLEFLSDVTSREAVPEIHLEQGAAEVAGITYRVRGSGPPLLLLPLSLSPSQWDPIVDALAERYTTLVLGGAFLGIVPTLEARMRGGYRNVVQNVVDAARPGAGESIAEIGCGSGAVARWLAHHTGGANPITAVDVNAYLLREAAALSESDPTAQRITYRQGDAQALPIPSDSFDVTLTFTVMEELDADRMLAELVRVTRPGGRVGVVVRAVDMLPWINVDLPDEVRRAAERVAGAGADEHGCADASLYRRCASAGLRDLVMGPQYGADTAQRSPERLRFFAGRIAGGLAAEDARLFRDSVRRATSDGTMVWAEPYHCAVGTRP
ncbi:MAG: class I SAM-dependent methyltransferase [Chloroflexi bacterium]|nr:class I SAM-dependent methyltransferase [Chloroflexota bacterium]